MANVQPDMDYSAELARAGAKAHGFWGQTAYLIRRFPLGAVGAVIFALLVFSAVFADFIAPYDPLQTSAQRSLSEPGGATRSAPT